jgi:glycosyltransferase involved in cell wall biosynthesis
VPWGERLGGAENVLWTFLRHADRQQILPTIVFFGDGPFEREVAGLGIQTVVVRSDRLRYLPSLMRTIRTTAELLRSQRPHLVVNWSAKTQLYGAAAACLAGMGDRVVWWQHGLPNGQWMDRLATLLPSRAIGCCSRATRLAQASQWPHREAYVVYPGIDRPPTLGDDERLALRSRLGIRSDRMVIGIVGRLQPWKGQHRFLRAFATLAGRGHHIAGLVVGGDAYNLSPGYEARLHRLARELSVQDRVVFTGHVPEAGPYLQLMDIAVSASTGEPFGLVLLEAMALGIPVVALASGGPMEILEDGRSGLLVPVGDEQAFADSLERLVLDEGLRQRTGRSGLERFQALFSAERMTREMELRLQELCPN